jgi:hypothetical protein
MVIIHHGKYKTRGLIPLADAVVTAKDKQLIYRLCKTSAYLTLI